MQYFVWCGDDEDSSFARIYKFPEEMNRNLYKLGQGISCKDWFPDNPQIQIEVEAGIVLTDVIFNYDDFLIVSEKIKLILEEHSGSSFEFFQISILDKKGRVDERSYYMANLLEVIDCVDMEKSEYDMDPLAPSQVDQFMRLVLNESKIDPEKGIFRLKDKTDLIIINHTLARKILEEGCAGVLFEYLDDHGEIFRD